MRAGRRYFTFGPFTLDADAGVLDRDGERVKLQPQPLRVLALLVSRAGEVVSRDDIQRALWPDRHVDFDASVNYCINQIRHALGEDRDRPGYIITVPRQGYRFVAPVAATVPAKVSNVRRFSYLGFAAGAAGLVALGAALRGPALEDTRRQESPALTQITFAPGEERYPALSPDGSTVAYAAAVDGNWDIYVQRVGGEKVQKLTADSADDDTQPAFSPDGAKIVFRSERDGGGLFLMGASGEPVRRLTDFGHNPSWSRDGRQIAFAEVRVVDARRANLGRLWRVDVVSGETRPVGTIDGGQPTWSPSGERIAYWAANRSGHREIWTVRPDGTDARRVTNDAFVDWSPVWSASSVIYFASDRGGSMNLWRINVDDATGRALTKPEPMTVGGATSHRHPSVSAAGETIAYVELTETRNIWRVKFDPTTKQVTREPDAITEGAHAFGQPQPSPDGEWLAFQSHGVQEDIFVVKVEGTELRQLTDDLHKDRTPQWSPDGQRIAFYSNRTGNYELWMIRPDGSGLTRLTESSDTETDPTWSPSGSRMSYWDVLKRQNFVFHPDVPWNMQEPEPVPQPDWPGDAVEVSTLMWSRDEARLAGHYRVGGVLSGVTTYAFDGRTHRRLTDSGGYVTWLGDSRHLFFLDEGVIRMVDSETGNVWDILSVLPDRVHRMSVSRNGEWLYFDRAHLASDVWVLRLKEES